MLHQNRQVFHYEIDETDKLVTAWAALPLITELFYRMGLNDVINEEIGARLSQGYSDAEQILSLMLLNITGGESVEDLKMLEGANAGSAKKGPKALGKAGLPFPDRAVFRKSSPIQNLEKK